MNYKPADHTTAVRNSFVEEAVSSVCTLGSGKVKFRNYKPADCSPAIGNCFVEEAVGWVRTLGSGKFKFRNYRPADHPAVGNRLAL